ncbi:hypothetical protein DPEC_G00016700 [Dallia pectoralis]|uniref:Uncharacterized protein n=1 Tax=Dallia pectoralis TaxID=75939 RepID=A0ACC2HNG8_DALPE|nr:hypothetical protein DPEC_G00016700 [Dallia pectoralis]
MAKLQSIFMFLNKRLTQAYVDIFVAVEQTVLDYQEENNWIRSVLDQSERRMCDQSDRRMCDQSEIRMCDQSERRMCDMESLPFSLSEEEAQQQVLHDKERLPSLGQDHTVWDKTTQSGTRPHSLGQDHTVWDKTTQSGTRPHSLGQDRTDLDKTTTTTQIKEEQEELWTNQEEEQIPGPSNTRDSIFTPHCVKSECDQQVHKAILTEYPTLSQFKTSKLKTFHVFLKDFFTVFASIKIFGAVEKMVSEYQEENDQLRRRLHLTPETELCTTEEVPSEEQQCEQERSPSLRQENPETMQIKEELGELWTNQEEEQSRGVEPDIIEFIIPPSCVKSECDQDPVDSLPQTQSVENRESDSKPGNLTSFDTVTQLERLTAAAGDIFGAVEQTLSEYIKDNDRLQRKLRVTPQIQLCTNDSLLLSGEVPPEEQDCEQERSLSLVQENPETMQIKEEQEELWTNQEEEQIPGPSNTRDSIFTPHCVKSECDQQVHKAILTEYPTLSQFKMSKLKTIHVFLKDFFTVFASMKIFGAVDKMVSEYQEENDQLRRRLHLTPETELCTTEEVPHEEQQCEQERSPSLRQENPETMQIKEELGELWTNQEEEQSRGVEPDIIEFIIPPSCVKSECDQDPVDSLPQTQSVENRESDSKPGNLTPFDTVTQLEVHCL